MNVPAPVTERFNRSMRGFDFNVASPIQAQALADYAQESHPAGSRRASSRFWAVPLSPASTASPEHFGKPNQNLFMPRFGFAYSLTPRP